MKAVVIDSNGLTVDFGDLVTEGWISPAFSITAAPSREDIRRRLAESGRQIQHDAASNPAFGAARNRAGDDRTARP